MTYQGGPDDLRRATEYIDRDTKVGWAPLVLGIVFIALLGFLMFGPSWIVPTDSVKNAQRSELPNAAPSAPPVPTPAPPKPQ